MTPPVPDFAAADWFKSSFSGGDNGTCVEVAFVGDHVGVRDSKQRSAGPVLIFSFSAWTAFLADLRSSHQ